MGIIVGTRPDCVSTQILDYFEKLSNYAFVMIEYGIESVNDATLRRIHRGHDFSCSREAIEMTAARNLPVGGHFILGLPGENESEVLQQAEVASKMPLDVVKLHQLQVLKGTMLQKIYKDTPFHLYTADKYVALVAQYLQRLRPDIAIGRFVSQCPSDIVVAPKWGLKNQMIVRMLNEYMECHGYMQGDFFCV